MRFRMLNPKENFDDIHSFQHKVSERTFESKDGLPWKTLEQMGFDNSYGKAKQRVKLFLPTKSQNLLNDALQITTRISTPDHFCNNVCLLQWSNSCRSKLNFYKLTL